MWRRRFVGGVAAHPTTPVGQFRQHTAQQRRAVLGFAADHDVPVWKHCEAVAVAVAVAAGLPASPSGEGCHYELAALNPCESVNQGSDGMITMDIGPRGAATLRHGDLRLMISVGPGLRMAGVRRTKLIMKSRGRHAHSGTLPRRRLTGAPGGRLDRCSCDFRQLQS